MKVAYKANAYEQTGALDGRDRPTASYREMADVLLPFCLPPNSQILNRPMEFKSQDTLPFMRTMEEAVEICAREQDNFYVTAFMLEAWLGEVTCRIVDEFSSKRSASKRRFQTGVAADLYADVFGSISDSEVDHFFKAVLRFGSYDDPQSLILRKAFWMTSREMPISEWPKPGQSVTLKSVSAFVREVLRRICDWVEAFSHAQMQAYSHWAPLAFNPDPEKRELALLGYQQGSYPQMTEFQRRWWQWHHHEAAERLSDPANWSMVAKAAASEATTIQNYPALDEAIILFWPLMVRHQWTYRDLANVLRSVAPSKLSYPCEREQDLASYCANVLGLRKSGPKGKTTGDGLPPGSDIAWMLCGKSEAS